MEDGKVVEPRYMPPDRWMELTGQLIQDIRRDFERMLAFEVEFGILRLDSNYPCVKRRSALWLSLGAAAASGGRVGVLDRVAGTWSLGAHTFQCAVFNPEDRQF